MIFLVNRQPLQGKKNTAITNKKKFTKFRLSSKPKDNNIEINY